jgi:hypothetical protein
MSADVQFIPALRAWVRLTADEAVFTDPPPIGDRAAALVAKARAATAARSAPRVVSIDQHVAARHRPAPAGELGVLVVKSADPPLVQIAKRAAAKTAAEHAAEALRLARDPAQPPARRIAEARRYVALDEKVSADAEAMKKAMAELPADLRAALGGGS